MPTIFGRRLADIEILIPCNGAPLSAERSYWISRLAATPAERSALEALNDEADQRKRPSMKRLSANSEAISSGSTTPEESGRISSWV
jgi:hypothetical protein